MKIFVFIGIILLLFIGGLFLVILFSKIKLKTNIYFQQQKKHLCMSLFIISRLKLVEMDYNFITEKLNLKVAKIPITIIKPQKVEKRKETKTEKKILKKIVRNFKKVKQKRKYLRLRKKIENIDVAGKINFGTGNAYTTGMILGGYNTFIYFIPQMQNLEVIPDFLNTKIAGRIKINLKLYVFKLLKGIIDVRREGKLDTN